MPKRRSSYPSVRDTQEPGVNRTILNHVLKSWKMPTVDTNDPQAIEDRMYQYLMYCCENDCPPSLAGCANWLGVVFQTIENWYTGRTGTPAHQRVAAQFYTTLQEVWAIDMHDGNINPVSGIFMGKVFYGYRDQQEIVVRQDAFQNKLSNADLIAEANRLPGAERLALTDGAQTIDIEARVIEPKKPRKSREERDAEKKAAEAEKRRKATWKRNNAKKDAMDREIKEQRIKYVTENVRPEDYL